MQPCMLPRKDPVHPAGNYYHFLSLGHAEMSPIFVIPGREQSDRPFEQIHEGNRSKASLKQVGQHQDSPICPCFASEKRSREQTQVMEGYTPPVTSLAVMVSSD